MAFHRLSVLGVPPVFAYTENLTPVPGTALAIPGTFCRNFSLALRGQHGLDLLLAEQADQHAEVDVAGCYGPGHLNRVALEAGLVNVQARVEVLHDRVDPTPDAVGRAPDVVLGVVDAEHAVAHHHGFSLVDRHELVLDGLAGLVPEPVLAAVVTHLRLLGCARLYLHTTPVPCRPLPLQGTFCGNFQRS